MEPSTVLSVYEPFNDGPETKSQTLSPRLTSLDGMTVGLLWNGKANGDVALARLGELLQDRASNLATNFYKGALPCDPSILIQAGQECDAVVACTAD